MSDSTKINPVEHSSIQQVDSQINFFKVILSYILHPQTIFYCAVVVGIFIFADRHPIVVANLPVDLTESILVYLSRACSWACLPIIFAAPLFTYLLFIPVFSVMIWGVGMLIPPYKLRVKIWLGIVWFFLLLFSFAFIKGISNDNTPRPEISLSRIEQNYEEEAQLNDEDDIYFTLELENTGAIPYSGFVGIYGDPEGMICYYQDSTISLAPGEKVTISSYCAIFGESLKNKEIPLYVTFSPLIFVRYTEPQNINFSLKTIPDSLPAPTLTPIPTSTPEPGVYYLYQIPSPVLEFADHHSELLDATYPLPLGWNVSARNGHIDALTEYRFENISRQGSRYYISMFSTQLDPSLSAEQTIQNLYDDHFQPPYISNKSLSFSNIDEGNYQITKATIYQGNSVNEYALINSEDTSYFFITTYIFQTSSFEKDKQRAIESLEQSAEIVAVFDQILLGFKAD